MACREAWGVTVGPTAQMGYREGDEGNDGRVGTRRSRDRPSCVRRSEA